MSMEDIAQENEIVSSAVPTGKDQTKGSATVASQEHAGLLPIQARLSAQGQGQIGLIHQQRPFETRGVQFGPPPAPAAIREDSRGTSSDEAEREHEKNSEKQLEEQRMRIAGVKRVLDQGWVKVMATVTTPYAEIDVMFRFPELRWRHCRMSPRILQSLRRVSYWMGAHDFGDHHIWCLNMMSIRPFPCVRPLHIRDVWERLEDTTGRIEIKSSEYGSPTQLRFSRPLVNEEDEVPLGRLDPSQLHLNISLFYDSERVVDDVTVTFVEKGSADPADSDLCVICQEPMLCGEMCRRMACLHRLHAGCAMVSLLKTPQCPVCRTSIVPAPPAGPLPAVLSPPSTPSRLPPSPAARTRTPSQARGGLVRPAHVVSRIDDPSCMSQAGLGRAVQATATRSSSRTALGRPPLNREANSEVAAREAIREVTRDSRRPGSSVTRARGGGRAGAGTTGSPLATAGSAMTRSVSTGRLSGLSLPVPRLLKRALSPFGIAL
jgi:hypothetical protein